jgi:hypothetical protein
MRRLIRRDRRHGGSGGLGLEARDEGSSSLVWWLVVFFMFLFFSFSISSLSQSLCDALQFDFFNQVKSFAFPLIKKKMSN